MTSPGQSTQRTDDTSRPSSDVPMDPGRFDFSRFEAVTFDCYGTLIDWETGILAGLHEVLRPHGIAADDDVLLDQYASHEAELEAGPYLRYREVLGRIVAAIAAEHGLTASAAEVERFAGSIERWPAYPDTSAAMARLATHYRLGVLTNCDDDLFAFSRPRLGATLDWVVTAQQVGSYKPAIRNFEVLLDRVGLPRERVLHVAQSLYHDHVPARRLGLTSVWINRRRGASGFGATPPAEAAPALEFPDMASFAEAAVGGR